MIEAKIESLLQDKFKEEGFTDCFLLEVKLHANRKLDVFIDSDTGITFGKCQTISRYLEQYLDEEGWLGESYVLEVSSPGVGRPLLQNVRGPGVALASSSLFLRIPACKCRRGGTMKMAIRR